MADLSSVYSHSRTSTVFFFMFIRIWSFMFLTTVSHIFSQLFLRGVMRLGGIMTECISKARSLVPVCTVCFSGASISCSGSIVDLIIIQINSSCQMVISQKNEQEKKTIAPIIQQYDQIIKLIAGQNYSFQTWETLGQKLLVTVIGCSIGSFLAVKQNYEEYRKKHKIQKYKFFNRTKFVLTSPFFLGTSSSFSCKILIDFYNFQNNLNYNQYEKGSIVGFASYLLNNPSKEIYLMQKKIQESVKGRKQIGRSDAKKHILALYGNKGFYKGEVLLKLVNSIIFFTLYFGVYGTLNHKTTSSLNHYIINPLIASLVASIPSFIINRVNYLRQNIEMSRLMFMRENKKPIMVFPQSINSVIFKNLKLIVLMRRKEVVFYINQLLNHWMMLSIFTISQAFLTGDSSILRGWEKSMIYKWKKLQ